MNSTFLLASACLVLVAGCTAEAKAGKTATAPSSNAGNEPGGEDGQQTKDADAGASVSYGSGAATVYVVNVANEEICYVYVGDGSGAWSSDLLGTEVLPVGYYLTVTGVAPGSVELYAEGCESADWYGSGTVDSEYTFILYGGGNGDSGSWDSGYLRSPGRTPAQLPPDDAWPFSTLSSWYDDAMSWF